MTADRDDLIETIRNLMSKTVGAGCTEPEALAALDKARALMDAYEVTEEELELTKDEAAVFRKEPPGTRDPHNIKFYLCSATAKFCNCKAWRDQGGELVFCGLPSDVRLATWLLDTLQTMSRRNWRVTSWAAWPRGASDASSSTASSAGAARGLAIVSTLSAPNLRPPRRPMGASSRWYRAGAAAGDRASFGRPVTGANAILRIKYK
jgi:hypothetical protein